MNTKAKFSVQPRGLLCFILVFLFSANTFVQAQEPVRITLELDNVTLETAVAEIESQSPYLFMNSGVDLGRRVSISVTDKAIREVCDLLFTPLRVNYRIENQYIVISDKPSPVPVTISGRISDESGLPVLDMAANLMELSAAVGSKLESHMEENGIELSTFVFESVSLPPELEKAFDENARLRMFGKNAEIYRKLAEADAIREAAKNNSAMGQTMGTAMGAAMGFGMGAQFSKSFQNGEPQKAVPEAAGAVCPACGKSVPANSKFCPECGKPIGSQFCPECGAKVGTGAKFCPECGKKL